MAKRAILQTIFREEETMQGLQDWANEFLKDHEAVNLQVCKNDNSLLQMMIVYKIEVEDDRSSTPHREGDKDCERVQSDCDEGKAECSVSP